MFVHHRSWWPCLLLYSRKGSIILNNIRLIKSFCGEESKCHFEDQIIFCLETSKGSWPYKFEKCHLCRLLHSKLWCKTFLTPPPSDADSKGLNESTNSWLEALKLVAKNLSHAKLWLWSPHHHSTGSCQLSTNKSRERWKICSSILFRTPYWTTTK